MLPLQNSTQGRRKPPGAPSTPQSCAPLLLIHVGTQQCWWVFCKLEKREKKHLLSTKNYHFSPIKGQWKVIPAGILSRSASARSSASARNKALPSLRSQKSLASCLSAPAWCFSPQHENHSVISLPRGARIQKVPVTGGDRGTGRGRNIPKFVISVSMSDPRLSTPAVMRNLTSS